jgi:hypothetical protein
MTPPAATGEADTGRAEHSMRFSRCRMPAVWSGLPDTAGVDSVCQHGMSATGSAGHVSTRPVVSRKAATPVPGRGAITRGIDSLLVIFVG